MKLLTCLLFLFPLVLPAQSEELTISSEGVNIGATLLLPFEETSGVALLIAGSGPTDRDGNQKQMMNNSLKMIAEGLAENGIASLRFDKRGLPGSPMDSARMHDTRFDDFAVDVAHIIRYLKSERQFTKVTIIGHSLGSLVGTLAAQDAPVDKFVSVAGMGFSMGETLRRQLSKQGPMVAQITLPIIDSLERGVRVDSVPPMLSSLFGESIQPYLISVMRYDPAAELAKLECPVLIINGTTDMQVTIEDGDNLVRNHPYARKLTIENMNHVLKQVSENQTANIATYNKPDMPLHPDLIPYLVGFIQEN